MTIAIRESVDRGYATIATRATLDEAKEYVREIGEVVFMEDDADFADCADAYLSDGRVISVQPVGFRL